MQKCKLNFLLRFGLISILLGLFVTQSFAQNVTITGVVKDQSGEPLIGVNVMERGRPMVPSRMWMVSTVFL